MQVGVATIVTNPIRVMERKKEWNSYLLQVSNECLIEMKQIDRESERAKYVLVFLPTRTKVWIHPWC